MQKKPDLPKKRLRIPRRQEKEFPNMKRIFTVRDLLRWLTCIGSFITSMILYPYNFYYQRVYLPEMTLTQIVILVGAYIAIGTVMWLAMNLFFLLGKRIGMKKNLIFYFLYSFCFFTLFSFAVDAALPMFDIEPNEMYLLLGFFPSMLYSVIYSYERSHLNPREN